MQPGPQPSFFDSVARYFLVRRMLRAGVLLALLGVCGLSCCAVFGLGSIMTWRTQQTFGALSIVCSGRGVAGAPAFVPGRPHRGVAFDAGSSLVQLGRLPDTWSATAIADDDFVLCYREATTATIETCPAPIQTTGGAPNIFPTKSRTQQTVDVRAVASATGATLAEGAIAGPLPAACETNGQPTAEAELAGGVPAATELAPWVTANLR